jgi:hypothetical protein
VIMGDQSASFPLQEIIQRQMDISSIRNLLLTPEAPLVKIVTEFWKETLNAGA